MTQMAALSFAPAPAAIGRGQPIAFVPPIQRLAVPIQQQFPPGGLGSVGGGRRQNRGRGRGRGGRGRTPFADYMRSQGGLGVGPPGSGVPFGGGAVPVLQGVPSGLPQVRNPDFSNIYKRHNN